MSRAGCLAVCAAWLDRPGAAGRALAGFEAAAGDPDAFIRELRGQRLTSVALEVGARLAAPERVLAPLGELVRAEAARSLALESSAAELAGAAAAGGLEAIVIKGPALDRRYGERGRRPFGDIDLLADAKDAAAWARCLSALGYRQMLPVDRTWRRGGTETVDLHFKSSDLVGAIDVPEELSPVRLDFAAMRARSGRLEGLPFPALCVEDELVVAAGHGLGVHVFERLLWLLDVAVLAGLAADAARLAGIAGESGAGRLVFHALDAAARLGLIDAREDLLGPLRPKSVGRTERRLMDRLVREGLPNQAEFLLALVLPAPRGYRRTLLGRALLPRRRALGTEGTGRGIAGGALRHFAKVLRIGALALRP